MSAGPQHRPSGKVGLALGGAAGLITLGPVGLVVGVVVGRTLWREGEKQQRIAMLPPPTDDDVLSGCSAPRAGLCKVKLWKAGETAPLSERGYQLVASDPRPQEMAAFVSRVLQQMGARVQDKARFRQGVLARCAGARDSGSSVAAPGFSTLRGLVTALALEPEQLGVKLTGRAAEAFRRELLPRGAAAAGAVA